MLKKPWFSIIEVTEMRGRSIADIAAEVARERGVSLTEMLSERRIKYVCEARSAAIKRVAEVRRDVTAAQIARYFNRDPSTIRKNWRRAEGVLIA